LAHLSDVHWSVKNHAYNGAARVRKRYDYGTAMVTVVVRIAETNGRLDVGVRDDGRGFEPSAPRSGFGLTGMRERVEMLGGTLAVESSEAGLGTLVRASIPVRHAD